MSIPAIKRIGGLVSDARQARNLTQDQLVEGIDGCNRSTISYLEQGLRLPAPDILEGICSKLAIPREYWEAATHEGYLLAIDFQEILSELIGKPVSIDLLDVVSQGLAIEKINSLLNTGMSSPQAHANFNSILTFYGEKGISIDFFERFLTSLAFSSLEAFRSKVLEYQKVAVRLYGSFRYAFKELRDSLDITKSLSPIEPINEDKYTQRRPFQSIELIESSRLDDLGYISAERVRRESKERQELSTRLKEIATGLRQDPPVAITTIQRKRLDRIQSLLRKFESGISLEDTLFSTIDADTLEREAHRVAPEDAELARIQETQEIGLKNLAAYLTEPWMDVYVATSMREKADFISVNTFIANIFSSPMVSHLNLRYFNPTMSLIEDRVAKGLVEALMLKRSSATIYMAQKSDTFGKDSEASVALGQGKPVIVYVPILSDSLSSINSERLMMADEGGLSELRSELKIEEDEEVDRQSSVSNILSAQLRRLLPEERARIVYRHWADFDLFGELGKMSEKEAEGAGEYLRSIVTASNEQTAKPLEDNTIWNTLVERLVSVAMLFERRAKTFREVHPLALQVILSTGVLNGILVVRSAEECAQALYRVITNRIETDFHVDGNNYKLIDRLTGSTLRVISRHRLLTNAFWTQYFK